MTISPISTAYYPTSQSSARTVPPAVCVLHHGATTSVQAIIAMSQGAKEVSCHQAVKDDSRNALVLEERRAWSLSDAFWDSLAFTVECANESTNGWTISAASHESLARLVADWSTRYGFPIVRSGDPRTWTVIGHREVYTIHGGSYATACPGGMNLDWIAARAIELQSGTPEPEPTRKRRDMFNGRHPNGAITAFGETSTTGLTAGMWRYYEPAYGPYVQLTAEEYEQEFINVKVRKAATLSGVVDEAAIAAQVRSGMDAYFAANKDRIAKLNASIGVPVIS